MPYERFVAVELSVREVMEITDVSRTHTPWQQFVNARTQPWSIHFNETTVHKKSFILGCMLSHMTLLSRIAGMAVAGTSIDDETSLYLILEDDVLLTESWRPALAESVSLLPPEWHMLRCNVRYVDKERRTKVELYKAEGDIKFFHGTHCVVTSPRRAAHILQQLKLVEVNDYDAMCTTNKFRSFATPNFRTKLGIKVVLPLQHSNATKTDHRGFKAKD
jgi:hypothetical protein